MSDLREVFKDILRDNIEGMSRKDARYYVENDAAPYSGSVSGLIYYGDTEPIAKNHHEEISEMIHNNFGSMKECQSLNDMTWMAWGILLPEIAEEVVAEITLEIIVPNAMIVAFSNMGDGLFMDAYTFVDEVINDRRVKIDSSISSDMEAFVHEIQAYIFYEVDSSQDMDEVEEACVLIEGAYIANEEYVELVGS